MNRCRLAVAMLGFVGFGFACSTARAALSTAAISQEGWTLKYVSSYHSWADKQGAKAFDGLRSTEWQSNSGSTVLPQEIQVDLGAIYTITGFVYLARQDGNWGNIKNYSFYVSQNGSSWTLAKSGTFATTYDDQHVSFSQQTGRYVRLKSLSEVAGRDFAAVAELNVLGAPSSSNPTPIIFVHEPRPPQPWEKYYEPHSTTVRAMASDQGAVAVTNVAFYASGTYLGHDTTRPYSCAWAGIMAGTYDVSARAFYADGSVAVSRPVTFTVRSSGYGTPQPKSGWTVEDYCSYKPNTDSGAAPPERTIDGSPVLPWVTEHDTNDRTTAIPRITSISTWAPRITWPASSTRRSRTWCLTASRWTTRST